jgi:hypothetical protein
VLIQDTSNCFFVSLSCYCHLVHRGAATRIVATCVECIRTCPCTACPASAAPWKTTRGRGSSLRRYGSLLRALTAGSMEIIWCRLLRVDGSQQAGCDVGARCGCQEVRSVCSVLMHAVPSAVNSRKTWALRIGDPLWLCCAACHVVTRAHWQTNRSRCERATHFWSTSAGTQNLHYRSVRWCVAVFLVP